MESRPEEMTGFSVDFSYITQEAPIMLHHREMNSRWRMDCRDPLVDVELWRRFGLAVRHSKLKVLERRMCRWLFEGLVERERAPPSRSTMCRCILVGGKTQQLRKDLGSGLDAGNDGSLDVVHTQQ
jgi:hypothetical protein